MSLVTILITQCIVLICLGLFFKTRNGRESLDNLTKLVEAFFNKF